MKTVRNPLDYVKAFRLPADIRIEPDLARGHLTPAPYMAERPALITVLIHNQKHRAEIKPCAGIPEIRTSQHFSRKIVRHPPAPSLRAPWRHSRPQARLTPIIRVIPAQRQTTARAIATAAIRRAHHALPCPA